MNGLAACACTDSAEAHRIYHEADRCWLQPTSDTSRGSDASSASMRVLGTPVPVVVESARRCATAPTFLSFTHYFSVLTSNQWFTARRNWLSVMIVRFQLVPHP
jgi:hypothetical protein